MLICSVSSSAGAFDQLPAELSSLFLQEIQIEVGLFHLLTRLIDRLLDAVRQVVHLDLSLSIQSLSECQREELLSCLSGGDVFRSVDGQRLRKNLAHKTAVSILDLVQRRPISELQ